GLGWGPLHESRQLLDEVISLFKRQAMARLGKLLEDERRKIPEPSLLVLELFRAPDKAAPAAQDQDRHAALAQPAQPVTDREILRRPDCRDERPMIERKRDRAVR